MRSLLGVASVVLCLIGQVEAGSAIGTLTNVTGLGLAAVLTCWVVPGMVRYAIDKFDGWEKTRHEDAVTMAKALTELTTQCARKQTTDPPSERPRG